MTDATAKPAKAAGKTEKKKLSLIGEMVEIVKTVTYALLIALVIRVVLFQPYTIPSASDEPNLYRGDYIIVTKWSYGWSQKSVPFLDLLPTFMPGRLFFSAPRRGDIVVFKLPSDGHTDFIKRLIGLPGDRIQIRGGQLFINDQPVKEQPTTLPNQPVGVTDPPERKGQVESNPEGRSYVTQVLPSQQATSPANNTGVYVVPPHCYFMMGDNRDNSLDSRFTPLRMPDDPDGPGDVRDPSDARLGGCGVDKSVLWSTMPGVGFVPEENLEGRAAIVLVSWNTGPGDEGDNIRSDGSHPYYCDTNPCASIFNPISWFAQARYDRFFRVLQ